MSTELRHADGAPTHRVGGSANGQQPDPADTTVVSLEERAADLGEVETERGTAGKLTCGERVAVLMPCRDEAETIAGVVEEFRAALPRAGIYVYDNGSVDETAERAVDAGAIVGHAPAVGKGNVLRRMFAEIDADAYVVVDGDGTYDAGAAPGMLHHLRVHHFDMVVGRRVDATGTGEAFGGHELGNRVLSALVQRLCNTTSCHDILSGYRVLSRRYVKSFPAMARGFDTEAEMTFHALDLGLPIDEIETEYRARPPDSTSKLRALPDGLRIARCILALWKDYWPLRCFTLLSILSVVAAAVVGGVGELAHLSVDRTLVLASAITAAGALLMTGAVLEAVSRSRRELKRILYLAVPYGNDRGVSHPLEDYGPPTVDLTA